MNTNKKVRHIDAANQILLALGMPRAQQNERSALCLLALLNLTPGKRWSKAENPLVGITPIMAWAREHYDKEYAPNTRETIRRQSIIPRKIGFGWSRPLRVTVQSMANDMRSWPSSLLTQQRAWFTSPRFQIERP